MNRSKLAFTALAIALSPTNVLAEALSKYGSVGEWQILVDASVGNGCLMEKIFEDGTYLYDFLSRALRKCLYTKTYVFSGH